MRVREDRAALPRRAPFLREQMQAAVPVLPAAVLQERARRQITTATATLSPTGQAALQTDKTYI